MKKVLTILMIAIIAASSVFAASGYLGVAGGYSFTFNLDKETKSDADSAIDDVVPLWLDGAVYFNNSDAKFGLSFGLDIVNVGLSDYISAAKQVYPFAGLAFRYDFGILGIGANLNTTYKWAQMGAAAEHLLGLRGDLFLNIAAGPVNIKAGAIADGNVALWAASGDVTVKVDEFKDTTMRVVPYASVGIAF